MWNCPLKLYITTDMRADIQALRLVLSNPDRFPWGSPISHLIPRPPSHIVTGDASVVAGGGYSFSLSFWWHVPWPQDVHQRTIKFRNDAGDGLLSINLLEFVVIILNYAASLLVTRLEPSADPFPRLLNRVDNRTALAWSQRAAKSSRHAQALGRVLANLLLASPLALTSDYISTSDNALADRISRSPLLFPCSPDFASLQQDYPQLDSCRQYLPSPDLLSTVYSALSHRSAPAPGAPVPLGRIIPASGTGSPTSTRTT